MSSVQAVKDDAEWKLAFPVTTEEAEATASISRLRQVHLARVADDAQAT